MVTHLCFLKAPHQGSGPTPFLFWAPDTFLPNTERKRELEASTNSEGP